MDTTPKKGSQSPNSRLTCLRYGIAWIGAILGLGLIAIGLLLKDTSQWRLHLLTGLWLLSLLPRVLLTSRAPVVARGLSRLSLLLVLGFGAIALQLARNQIIQAQSIHARAAAILQPTAPPVPPTPTPIPAAARTVLGNPHDWPVELRFDQRGKIFDRFGNVLAVTENGQRRYPNPNLGAIVGFQSRLFGVSGIEASFDAYLSGKQSLPPEDLLKARLLNTAITITPADVYLTLDTRLQEVAQNALGNRAGAVVVIEPRTGAILVLVTYPRFDPNQVILPAQASEVDVTNLQAVWDTLAARPDGPLLNRATQGRYPPGSIIKTLTAAAALDSGVMEFPESTITCPNWFDTGEVGAPPVRNSVANLAGWTGNPTDLRRAYAFSCNTAFAQIGLMLGPERFSDYAARFGLSYADTPSPPNLREIAADAGTVASNFEFLQRPAALADTAFGQGQLLITPLDMAQMVAIIANNGNLMRPYLVQEARTAEQSVYTAQPEVLHQAISAAAAEHMRSIMQTSVQIGYALPVAIPGVTIGAKTGTAENPSGVPHSWFVAIAPLEEPRFAIAVVVENGGEGSVSALPVARQVLAAAFQPAQN